MMSSFSIELRFIWMISCLLCVLGISPSAGAQNGGNALIPTGESHVWIEGRATGGKYRCETQDMEGQAYLKEGVNRKEVSDEAVAELAVPAESLDCGKRKMNRDLYEALKVDEHPNIRFELLSARLLDEPPSQTGDETELLVQGTFEIAGVSREYEMEVTATKVDDQRYRAEGHQDLNMHDFDITPPTAMLGLIKADEKLTVYFDIVVEPEDK